MNRSGWDASFTQEWPLGGVAHQVSYSVPFDRSGVGEAMVHYRYQALSDSARPPAFSPRVSLIIPRAGSESGVQVALPFSKRAGPFYLHANAGVTHHADQLDSWAGGSVVWRQSSSLNLLVEAIVQSFEEPGEEHAARHSQTTVAPGFRKSLRFDDKELVFGLAAPITMAPDASTSAAFVYLSYELPFKK